MADLRRIVVLLSGRGSNLRALHEAAHRQRWPAAFVGVVSDRPEAPGLAWARAQGLPTAGIEASDRPTRDARLAEAVEAWQPDLVLLAGYMRLLAPAFVQRWRGRLLNIHPSLLPAFAGLHTHRRVLAAGCRFSGATVHGVIDELDAGPILGQALVPVLPDDDEARLAARVLAAEHQLYPQVVAAWLAGRLQAQADGHGRRSS